MEKRVVPFLKYTVLLFFTFVSLYPIFLMIISSFKTKREISTSPLGFPNEISLRNFIDVWNKVHFDDYFLNSVFVTGTSVVVILLITSMGAFYLARYSFRWNGVILFFFMLGLMLPMKLAISPLYLQLMKLNLLDTHVGLIIVYIAGHISFAVFLFYGFFGTVPKELDQSAKIDGCSDFQVYWRIMLPLMRPAIATVAITNMISLWNDFFYPLIFIKSTSKGTIPLGMLSLFGEYDTEWHLLFAGLTLSSLPMIIAFLFASRQFIDGLTAGAIKT